MQFTAKQISEFLDGSIDGNPDVAVTELSKIEDGKEGSLSFLSNPKYENFLYSTRASVVIVSKDFAPAQSYTSTLIRVDNPYSSFTILLDKYNEAMNAQSAQSGIDKLAFVHPSAKIGKNVFIDAFAYVAEGVIIGDGCRLNAQTFVGANSKVGDNSTFFPGVKVYHNSIIGSRVTVHSNTVIGSDGFGFAPQKDGTYNKIPQIGNVIIEDDVEIGANTTVDRATMGSTIVKKGAKIDNLIQIAHNVEIGENTVLAAQSGISGSTKIGPNSVVGGQVGIAGHLTLAKGTQIGAQAGINFNITEEDKQWHGSPAQPLRNWMRASVIFKHLPAIEKRINTLEEELKKLTAELEKNTLHNER
ncbi:UDP-3-O-(3-hydroxymyristoyl)glucosamine N-acyltransferase [Pedobacter sp. BMA]|uniref:UDP-3-O-(3-hydroxymyristoyl)glucosamine N-acyltransferase n=1 Tax=Pedobacter sp. BMA TaxID=1663685 RepID=UPI0006494C5E|nr:UDP-3-O-(3-hydroxymyristoyl)glucosamine N-acyltransferase [Pedobacter sp. BMA]KLT64583.1 UDP-3-O-(3-hydroxymyristoyl) glucosamine N-acyltransferase [Pedobacter sp. BMA]